MFIHHLKKLVYSAAVAAALAGGVWAVHHFSMDPELVAKNRSLSDELSRLEVRNRRLQADNERLEGEIVRLRGQDSESVHHARTALGMVRPGEVVYQFPARGPADAERDPAPAPVDAQDGPAGQSP